MMKRDTHIFQRNINANNGAVGKTYVLVNKKNLKQFSTVCLLFRKTNKDSKDSIMICDGPGVFQKCLIQIIKMLRNMALFMLIIMKISMIRVHFKKVRNILLRMRIKLTV